MLLNDVLERLAAIEPTGFPFISLYLNLEPDKHGRDQYDVFVRNEFSARANTYPASSAERESFQQDTERILAYLHNEVRPQANGLAIFACAAADDLFEPVQLGAPIPNHRLVVAEQPHLYPLARLIDQYPRYAVLTADTNAARLFVFGRGLTLNTEQVQNIKTNRTRVGGWSQMRYQRHIDHYHLHHAKEVVETLDRVVREDDAQHIILAGDEVIIPLLKEQMPQRLTEKVIDVTRLDITTPEHDIYEATMEIMREHNAQTDAEKVADLLGEYRAGGLAVVGVADTLKALANGQVDELLIHATPRAIDYNERKVEKTLAPYEADGGVEFDTSDPRAVADELVRRAQTTGAAITFIEDTALLADVGGVGAWLRYRV